MENSPNPEKDLTLYQKDQRVHTENYDRNESRLDTKGDEEINILNFNPYSKKAPFLTRYRFNSWDSIFIVLVQ